MDDEISRVEPNAGRFLDLHADLHRDETVEIEQREDPILVGIRR
jgi:hypothetical protein